MGHNSQCCHTKHHLHVSLGTAVADNRPSAAFWFDHQPRPTQSRDVREEEEELSGHTGCRDSRYRHPERSLSRAGTWLGRPCCALSYDRASTMASRPINRVDRKTYFAEWTGCSSEGQHAQNGWPYPPKKLSPYCCAICASIASAPRICSLLLVCRVQAPPLKRLSQDVSGRQGPCRMAPMAWCRTPRQCQRLRFRMLRPGRGRTFAPAPARHDIPIDGLFSFTLPYAMQNTWYLLPALWLRDQQNHSSHVGTVETLGAGSIDTASEGARIAHPSRPGHQP